jgi:DNA polymerase III epsilon subunit-like protein
VRRPSHTWSPSVPIPSVGFMGRPLAVLDFEFTGLDPRVHQICEVAVLRPHLDALCEALPPTHPSVLDGWDAWSYKVMPTQIETASEEALQLNGFDIDQWQKEAIGVEQMLDHLELLLHEVNVVGHNAHLDLQFLEAAFREADRAPMDLKYRIDTTTLIWEHLVPMGLTRGGLAGACTVLGVTNEGAHRALDDVVRTLLVLWRLHDLRRSLELGHELLYHQILARIDELEAGRS